MVILRGFIPEMLYPNVAELRDNYLEITGSDLKKEFENLKSLCWTTHTIILQVAYQNTNKNLFKERTCAILGLIK